jgi:ubiquinone/menaquinone biosynthesis C-methylase UbiE
MGAWRHFPEPQRVLDEVCRVLRPDGVFLVGYFPPKLGGLLSVPSGTLGRVTVLLYCRLMRLLKYNDRTDQELERQILGMIELAFAQCHLIQSENREYLIFAESPLLDSWVCRGQYTSNRWRGPVKH